MDPDLRPRQEGRRRRALTLDDVVTTATADPDHRYELQEGNLLVMRPGDSDHAAIQADLIVWLRGQGHGRGQVLANTGLRVPRRDNPAATGRSPDVAVCRQPRTTRTVWLDPAEVLLVVEIVSPGSEDLDRVTKPIEYAGAGIPNYWRVEREAGPATVHAFRIGTGVTGQPEYMLHRTVLLDDLLEAESAAALLAKE